MKIPQFVIKKMQDNMATFISNMKNPVYAGLCFCSCSTCLMKKWNLWGSFQEKCGVIKWHFMSKDQVTSMKAPYVLI